MRTTTALALTALSLGACVHASDVEIRNPIIAKTIDPNKIVKPHEYTERDRGLPPGSLSDEAQLLTADDQQLCFGVTMRELAALDINQVQVKMWAPKLDALEQAQMWPNPGSQQTYNGRIPERRQTGVETYCASRDAASNMCLSWQTRPTYAIFYIPGPVTVYTASGRMCFPNKGVLTPQTEQVSLELRTRVQSYDAAYVGAGGLWGGHGNKKVVFRWGFPPPAAQK